MKEKLFAIFIGFLSGMFIYSIIGFYFTRKLKTKSGYRNRIIIFLLLLLIVIILRVLFK